MTNKSKVVVLKFGSSVLRSEKDLPNAVHEIYRWWRDGAQVIAVVSAFGDTTDQLMRRAETICSQPDKTALASLLATGEAASSALLALALNRTGIPSRVLDAVQVGLRTVGGGLEADPVAVDTARLLSEARSAVVVMPGFVGRGEYGDTTLLGRGGSDYTALFLAQRLHAQCVLLKDVDGLYTSDPASNPQSASRFAQVSYDTTIRLGGLVVQPKAVRFAAAHKLTFAITSIGANAATKVGPFHDHLDAAGDRPEPLRIALLGCGTVGGGVYERLAALPELFFVTGVGTRTRDRAADVPEDLITADLEALVKRPCDVVIELIGGTRRAAALIEWSLRLGRHVVSANKTLLASKGEPLETLAAENGVTLRYSAAVGGALPALETIKQARLGGPLRGFSGVLNGTCNFVLDRLTTGETMTAAVRAAQELGYAEAHPKFDLNGIDAAEKLVLLARAAFDVSLPLDSIQRKGIDRLGAGVFAEVKEKGQTLRLVTECRRTAGGLDAWVKPVPLAQDHPLAKVRGAGNRLIVEAEAGGRLIVSGEGAGRWPTTEAVMADLFDIRRSRIAEELEELEECVA
jgi:homoserine dehydrogenase